MELLGSDINATTSSNDDADGLVDRVDALKDVVDAATVGCVVDGSDTEDVDAIDKAIHDPVLALDADDHLATGRSEGIITDGGF